MYECLFLYTEIRFIIVKIQFEIRYKYNNARN